MMQNGIQVHLRHGPPERLATTFSYTGVPFSCPSVCLSYLLHSLVPAGWPDQQGSSPEASWARPGKLLGATRRCCHLPCRLISNDYPDFWIFWKRGDGASHGGWRRGVVRGAPSFFHLPCQRTVRWQSLGHLRGSIQPRTHEAPASESK